MTVPRRACVWGPAPTRCLFRALPPCRPAATTACAGRAACGSSSWGTPYASARTTDGRATYPELQRATGRSESAVARRLSALIVFGTVYVDTEYDTEPRVSPGRRDRITTVPGAPDSVGRTLATHDEVAFASATAGPSHSSSPPSSATPPGCTPA
ncbi:hypothetical protein [Streptomyces sp. NPDC058294]|uniref:hypothetical protein n=1 Tax=Streptomyces sp. NPDC058294 TaxID=3346430 RepID=UPI0036EDBFD9